MEYTISDWANSSTQTDPERTRLDNKKAAFSRILSAAEDLYLEAQADAKSESTKLKNNLHDALQRIENLKRDLEISESQHRSAKSAVEQERRLRIAAETRLHTGQAEWSRLKSETALQQQTLESQIETLRKEHQESLRVVTSVLEKKVKEQKLAIASLRDELESLRTQKSDMLSEINANHLARSESDSEKNRLSRKIRSLQSETASMQHQLNDQADELATSQDALSRSQTEVRFLKKQSSDLAKQKELMEKELSDNWVEYKSDILKTSSTSLADPASALRSLTSKRQERKPEHQHKKHSD